MRGYLPEELVLLGPEPRHSLISKLDDAAATQAWDEFVHLYEPVIYRVARGREFFASVQRVIQGSWWARLEFERFHIVLERTLKVHRSMHVAEFETLALMFVD